MIKAKQEDGNEDFVAAAADLFFKATWRGFSWGWKILSFLIVRRVMIAIARSCHTHQGNIRQQQQRRLLQQEQLSSREDHFLMADLTADEAVEVVEK